MGRKMCKIKRIDLKFVVFLKMIPMREIRPSSTILFL